MDTVGTQQEPLHELKLRKVSQHLNSACTGCKKRKWIGQPCIHTQLKHWQKKVTPTETHQTRTHTDTHRCAQSHTDWNLSSVYTKSQCNQSRKRKYACATVHVYACMHAHTQACTHTRKHTLSILIKLTELWPFCLQGAHSSKLTHTNGQKEVCLQVCTPIYTIAHATNTHQRTLHLYTMHM